MSSLRLLMLLVMFVLILAGLPAPAQVATCTNPPRGMVAWWGGDNTTTDFFGISNGLTSSPVSFATGEVGSAFSFDGLQYTYLQVPDTAELESMTTAITVDAWVKAASSPGTFRYILAKGASANAASYALYTGSGGGMAFYVSNGATFVVSPAAPPTLWDGNWHHVAGTFDGSTVHLIVDGSEIGSGSATPPNFSIAYNLPLTNDGFLGDFDPGQSGPFTFAGQVDELQVFSRVLSATEIQAIYNAGTRGECKDFQDLRVSTTANPAFSRAFEWSIQKSVDTTMIRKLFGTATFNYTVKVLEAGYSDSAWSLTGNIMVTNPNPGVAITGVNITDGVNNGGACSVSGGTNITLPAGGSITLSYNCKYGSAPALYSGSHTATASWDKMQNFTPNGLASGAANFGFGSGGAGNPTAFNQNITVTDTFTDLFGSKTTTLGTLTGSASPQAGRTFNYSRSVLVPLLGCWSHLNTASITQTGQSSSQTVTACGLF